MNWWNKSDLPKACFAFIFGDSTSRKQHSKCSCYLDTIVIAGKGAAWNEASTAELHLLINLVVRGGSGGPIHNPLPPLSKMLA